MFMNLNPRTARISAELAALYNDDPHAHRIDPAALAAIEDAGCTFDFETGEVHLPPARRTVPVVGVVDSHTGTVRWHNAAEGKRFEDAAPRLYFRDGQEYIKTSDGQERRIDRDSDAKGE